MGILLAALAGLVPLFISPGVLFHYDVTPRIAAIAMIAAIGLMRSGPLAAGIGALRSRRLPH